MRPATLAAARAARPRNRRLFRSMRSDLQDTREIAANFHDSIAILQPLAQGDKQAENALASIATMCAIALRHMHRSQHEELLSEARTVTIGAFMGGIEVVRGAA